MATSDYRAVILERLKARDRQCAQFSRIFASCKFFDSIVYDNNEIFVWFVKKILDKIFVWLVITDHSFDNT